MQTLLKAGQWTVDRYGEKLSILLEVSLGEMEDVEFLSYQRMLEEIAHLTTLIRENSIAIQESYGIVSSHLSGQSFELPLADVDQALPLINYGDEPMLWLDYRTQMEPSVIHLVPVNNRLEWQKAFPSFSSLINMLETF
ncbi:MAG: hypothetical protein H6741_00615 [Alphaproteobacteria bacterium]|nr:hypothetical protein [Alphaproteobacteria bacterium]MCB9791207.1 hypothetical protein [Alphaproteobacteria bacterium]